MPKNEEPALPGSSHFQAAITLRGDIGTGRRTDDIQNQGKYLAPQRHRHAASRSDRNAYRPAANHPENDGSKGFQADIDKPGGQQTSQCKNPCSTILFTIHNQGVDRQNRHAARRQFIPKPLKDCKTSGTCWPTYLQKLRQCVDAPG
jgi:hypothetical protein